MPSRERELSRLGTPENKRRLNSLLHIYDPYVKLISRHLENPSKTTSNLNVFYRNTFAPHIKKLIKDLCLTPTSSSTEKIQEHVLFTNLFLVEEEILQSEESIKNGRIKLYTALGRIKELAEDVGAVNQPTIPEVENVIWKLHNLMHANKDEESLSLGVPPELIQNKGRWYIKGKKKKEVLLSKTKSISGEFLRTMIESWGALRDKQEVLNMIEERTGKEWSEESIKNAMRDINKRMKDAGFRFLRLETKDDKWRLLYK
jgi:hypothetical protein